MMEIGADGRFSGFSIQLAQMIGAEIGHPIRFKSLPDPRSLIQAQSQGDVHLLAGIVALPDFKDTQVFSDPVIVGDLRFVVLEDRVDDFPNGVLRERRIGVVPPMIGSAEYHVLDDNIVIPYESAKAAVMSLLIGEVDALLIPNPIAHRLARAARADGRVRFIGDPVQSVTRVVAVHKSRSDLLGPINEAIAKMEADGRLNALRLAYNVTVPLGPPTQIVVGVTDFPPYNIIHDTGEISGFAVEALRDLGDLIGANFDFRPISLEEFTLGPSENTFDMLPQAGINADRASRMDFTFPIEKFEFSIFARHGQTARYSDLEPLVGRRVGVERANMGRRLVEDYSGIESVIYDGLDDLVQALMSGAVDAVVYPSVTMNAGLARLQKTDDIAEVLPPFKIVERAPALRPGLGSVREALNAVIPAYLLSEDYANLRRQYFEVQPFWSKNRISLLLAFGIIMPLILACSSLWFWRNARHRERQMSEQRGLLRREQAHSADLHRLVAQLELTNREQSQFTYAISHDLKAPNNTMAMLLQDLNDAELSETEKEEILSDMQTVNRRMGTLIVDVLGYAELVGNNIEQEEVDLNEIVNNVIHDLASDIRNAHGKVTYGDLPKILGDKTQLRMLFQNLIGNALKFREPDRSPVVDIQSHSARDIHISISDNGIGIPQTQHETVFGLFKRLNLKSKYEGSGMGLAICRRVMENHSGSISCRSQLGHGTIFNLVFQEHPH